MRIAFITYEFPPDTGKGGIGTYVSQVSTMLARAGCDVHVFAGSHSRQADALEKGVNVHWVKCSDPDDFKHKVLTPFAAEQKASGFDLMESPEIHGNASEVKRAFPHLPLIVRLHGPNWLVEHTKEKYIPLASKLRFVMGALRRGKVDPGYWRRYDTANDLDRRFALMADSITAPSSTMKNWAEKHWKLPADSITVIPNKFTPLQGFMEQPIAAEENTEIVFFGRLNVLKGLVNATHAMKRILKEHSACRFKVIGDDGPGPDHKVRMRQWMRVQLKPYLARVEFCDGLPYDRLPEAIENASIVLLPSLFESFSYTCAEAMAAGKAVIGSRGTGMQDMIQHEINGVLIDPDEPAEIFAAIDRLLRDKDLRRSLSVAARETISNQFDDEKLTQTYLDHFRRVILSS
ncbi:MAG: glycosyltransferase family 4 protein [Gemmatimonadales bacterium]